MTRLHLPAAALCLALAGLSAMPALAAGGTVETIVFLRHGEKPDKGLGQLNCQGLNRALALPPVLAARFPGTSAVFAPDPSKEKEDGGAAYSYVRPLATIEPTAVTLGLPVDTRFGYDEIDGLQTALEKPGYRNATVLVAWEHKQIVKLARHLMRAHGGDVDAVPKWPGSDFDSLYVLTISRDGANDKVAFQHLAEHLDGQPASCATPK